MTQIAATPLLQRPGFRQFAKFCIIGASSTLIDFVISYVLLYKFGLNLTLAKSISFVFGVSNGFIWNSRWTFRGQSSGAQHEMYIKFIAVNLIGFVLNIIIFKGVIGLFTGRFIGQGRPAQWLFVLAYGVAVVITSAWNFFANKKWTFKAH